MAYPVSQETLVLLVALLKRRYGPQFDRYIEAHVVPLVNQGLTSLRRTHRRKQRTVDEHESRRILYRAAAVTAQDWNRVHSFEREIERLRTELEILHNTTSVLEADEDGEG